MNPSRPSPPLDDAELARVDALLERANPEESMIVEEVDGFFAALACVPRVVPAEEWLPEVLGDDPDAVAERMGSDEWEALARLLNRHRESVAAQLYEGEDFSPVLAYDDAGHARANAWAVGFVRGLGLSPDAWDAIEDDEEIADALDPVMELVEEVEAAGEGDDADEEDEDDEDDEDEDEDEEGEVRVRRAAGRDPAHRGNGNGNGNGNGHGTGAGERDAATRAADDEGTGEGDDDEDDDESFDPEARRELIQRMIEGVMDVYDRFRDERERNLAPDPIRRDAPKVGRNDPCPCGSGRKYKSCHGR